VSRLARIPIVFSILLACAAPDAPDQAGQLDPGPAETVSQEPGLDWNTLTRLARENLQRGELREAEERLDQAAAQVDALPPFDARRRAVFGMQARLAIALAEAGEPERADALANRLFDVAEQQPQIGDTALVDLARSYLERHETSAEPLTPEQELRVLDIALMTAQKGAASRHRLELAFEISQEAQYRGALALARRAIEQARADQLTLEPGNQLQLGSIDIFVARIALDQDDLVRAEEAAISANQLFEASAASDAQRAIGEITLAQVLARKGEAEKARLVTRTAQARILEPEGIDPHAWRTVLGGIARVEATLGDRAQAREHYRQALAAPAADYEPDQRLTMQLRRELAALDAAPTSAPTPPPAGEEAESSDAPLTPALTEGETEAGDTGAAPTQSESSLPSE
jgi:tetratricopeptide (TPR) repeat protein